jgi:hypothetical protein
VNGCISNIESIGGQGFVWWDNCGDRNFAGACTLEIIAYYRRCSLSSFIDTLFSNIRNSGLVPGISIRDDDVYYPSDHWACTNYPDEATRRAQISGKIQYAYSRWAGGGGKKFII